MDDQIVGLLAENASAIPPETEEGRQLLQEFTGAEQQVQVTLSSENYNLAEGIPEEKAKEIANEIKQGYEDDKSSLSEWEDMHAFWLSLYMQTDYAENSSPDRDWGATESIPILTEACNQFQSRTYKTFFPQQEFVSAKVIQHTLDPIKQKLLSDRAERIGRHMSWQLGIKDKNYRKDKSALFLGVGVHGSFFTKTYFDTFKKKRPVIENVRPTDLVVNYHCGPIRIEDVSRKSHIINTTLGKTEQLFHKGFFSREARPGYNESSSVYNLRVNESMGITEPKVSIRRDEPTTLIEQHFYLDIDDTGEFLPYIGTIDLSSGRLLRLTIGYDADPMGKPTHDYEQIQYFTHYKFMENPDGFYGLGMGHMLGDLNSAVNIMTRQAMDAATLANDGNMSGYISEKLCLNQEDEVSLSLGKLKKIPDATGDLQNGIMMMKFPGPNPAMLQIIEALDQRAQRLGSITEATTGSIDTNRQPTTVLAQIEQSLELFSSVQMNLADALGDELNKVYRLNQNYLPVIDYFTVNDMSDSITRSDYTNDMEVEPVFDPKFSTRSQKVAKSQAEWQAIMENPLSQTRPWVYDIGTRRRLEALEVDNIDELVPPTQVDMIVNAIQGQANANSAQGMAQGPVDPMGNGPALSNVPAPLPQLTSQPGAAPADQLAGGMPVGA